MPKLPDEAENLKNIFEHHQDSFKYEVAFNFSKAAFTQTFVANGKDAAIFHLAGHGVAEGFVIDGDAQNESILDANILTVFLQNSAQLQIVFINACQSFDTINAINTLNIPLRIGTKHNISDADAMAASVEFYNALLKGHTFEVAFDALNHHYFLLNRNDTNIYKAIWQSETAKNLVLNLKNNQKDNDGFAHALNASPFLQTQTIIGRDEDIKKIHDLLFIQKQLLLMNAMGGIGKTAKREYDTALNYSKKDIAICENILGVTHLDTAASYSNIANIYYYKKNYNTALDFYKKAVIILKKVLTLQHDTTKRIFNNYKTTLNKVAEKLPNDIISAHVAFIQAEFSEYLD